MTLKKNRLFELYVKFFYQKNKYKQLPFKLKI